MVRRETPDSIAAYEQLAIYYEHRERDFARAAEFAEGALDRLREQPNPYPSLRRISHRLDRPRRKTSPRL